MSGGLSGSCWTIVVYNVLGKSEIIELGRPLHKALTVAGFYNSQMYITLSCNETMMDSIVSFIEIKRY